MVKYFYFILFGCSLYLNGEVITTTVFDTSTAYSLKKAEYQVDSFIYKDGGMINKFTIGINKYINLGILFYVDGLLGFNKVKWNLPGVSIKFRLLDQELSGHNIALGFDSFYHGSFSSSPNKKIYGPYFVYTKGFSLGKNFFNPSLFSVGVRYPVIFELGHPNVFSSIYFSLSKFFDIASEIENLHFVKQFEYYFIWNNILVFKWMDKFSVNIVFQLALKDKSNSENKKLDFSFSRGLRLSFKHEF